MGNALSGTASKFLTLLPILAVVYFSDFPKFWAVLTTGGQGALFMVAVSLFVLGVILKRKILGAYLEISRTSFVWGLPLLAVAAFLYIYGSYTANGVWYYYESLYVLVLAYVALRMGTGILRALAPLLAILVFSFPLVGFFAGPNDRLIIVFLSADLTFVLFLVFVRLRMKAMIIPSAVILLGLLAWYKSPSLLLGHQLDLLPLIPLPLLILLIPRVRRFVSLPAGARASLYTEHHLLSDGFCSICGLKLARAQATENFGLWGLLVVIGVAALLIFATVPVLALIGDVPYDAYYTPHGYSGTITPSTPPGWQINSTTHYDLPSDTYAIVQVYVPIVHPETKNYTMYYELALVPPPYSNGPFGIDIPGWNRTNVLNNDVQLGPFYGHLTTFVAPDRVMLAYQGMATMVFLNGNKFEQYYVSIGFVREFKNSNVSADTTQFFGDLNGLWVPELTSDLSLSVWTGFLLGLDQGSSSVGPILLTISSMGALAWAAYRARLSDERLDRFLNRAAVQPEEYWGYLSRLIRLSHHAGTGQELAYSGSATSGPPSADHLDSTLQELEHRHLVTRALVEKGADVISVWKAAL